MSGLANHWPSPTAAKGGIFGDLGATAAVTSLGPDRAVEIRVEGAEPFRTRWAAFVRDNVEGGLDWAAVVGVLAAGGTWRDGGGASPGWSLRLAP